MPAGHKPHTTEPLEFDADPTFRKQESQLGHQTKIGTSNPKNAQGTGGTQTAPNAPGNSRLGTPHTPPALSKRQTYRERRLRNRRRRKYWQLSPPYNARQEVHKRTTDTYWTSIAVPLSRVSLKLAWRTTRACCLATARRNAARSTAGATRRSS